MVEVANQGLTRAKEVCQDRLQRAKELKAEGGKVVGYFTIYSPIEMLTAFDLVPIHIFGDIKETITRADTFLPTVVCPYIRSCLDIGLKGRYDFLDGTLFCHACDVSTQLSSNWNINIKPPFSHYLDLPHTVHEEAGKHQKDLLKDFLNVLQESFGKEISPARLKEAIEVHNQQRALVRELYDLRKPDPPLMSGTETHQVIIALMSLPVEEGNKLLREVINEVKERQDGPSRKSGRLLVWGSMLDNTAYVEMIESLDANVVMDDIEVGSRAYFTDVALTDDPLDGLNQHYLAEIRSPRTHREYSIGVTKKDYKTDLDFRFSYLRDYIKEWQVNGVVLEVMMYCDDHAYEVPSMRDYLNSLNVPNVFLENDYTEGALSPARTRIQGFIEIIG